MDPAGRNEATVPSAKLPPVRLRADILVPPVVPVTGLAVVGTEAPRVGVDTPNVKTAPVGIVDTGSHVEPVNVIATFWTVPVVKLPSPSLSTIR